MPTSTKTILLVEDDASLAKLTLLAFKSCGVPHQMVIARDGEEAVEYLFSKSNALPALALIDLNLPKIDGIEILKRVRADERTKFLPVVILSAANTPADVARSYAAGATAYVQKPHDFTMLEDGARALALFWLTLNELPPVATSAASLHAKKP